MEDKINDDDSMMPKLVGESKKVFWKHSCTIRIELIRHDRDNVIQVLLFNKKRCIKPLLVDLEAFGKKYHTDIEGKVNEILPQPKFLCKNPSSGTEVDRNVVRKEVTNEIVMKFVLDHLLIQGEVDNDEDQSALTMTLPEDILYTKPVLLLPFVDKRQHNKRISDSFDAFATLRLASQATDLPQNLRSSVFFEPFCVVQERRRNIKRLFRRAYQKVVWMNALDRTKQHLHQLHVKMMKKKARQEMQKAKEKLAMETAAKEDAKRLKQQQKQLKDRLEKIQIQQQQEQQTPRLDRNRSRRSTATSPVTPSSSSCLSARKSLTGLAGLRDQSSASSMLSARKTDSPSSSCLSARKMVQSPSPSDQRAGSPADTKAGSGGGGNGSGSGNCSGNGSVRPLTLRVDTSTNESMGVRQVEASDQTISSDKAPLSQRECDEIEENVGVSRRDVLHELDDDNEDRFDYETPVYLTATLKSSDKTTSGKGLRRVESCERGLSDMLNRSERNDLSSTAMQISPLSDKGYSLRSIDSMESGLDDMLNRSCHNRDRHNLLGGSIHSFGDMSMQSMSSQQDMVVSSSSSTFTTSTSLGLPRINLKESGLENMANCSGRSGLRNSSHEGSILGLSSVVSTDSLLDILERQTIDSSSRTIDWSTQNMDVTSTRGGIGGSSRTIDGGYSQSNLNTSHRSYGHQSHHSQQQGRQEEEVGSGGGGGSAVGKAWSGNITLLLDFSGKAPSTTVTSLDDLKSPRRLVPLTSTKTPRSNIPRMVTPQSSPMVSPVNTPRDTPREMDSSETSKEIEQSADTRGWSEWMDGAAVDHNPLSSSPSFPSPSGHVSPTSAVPMHRCASMQSPAATPRSHQVPPLAGLRPSLSDRGAFASARSSKGSAIAAARCGCVLLSSPPPSYVFFLLLSYSLLPLHTPSYPLLSLSYQPIVSFVLSPLFPFYSATSCHCH